LREKIRAAEGLIAELSEGDEALGGLRSLPGFGAFFPALTRHEAV
jgi:hypothetical protein